MSLPPFVVLHVCLGNICRSPMAERLLAHRVAERLGRGADAYVQSESAGTGDWHVGEAMYPQAARELRRRGANDKGYAARTLVGAHVETADLILTATGDQSEFVAGLRPDAADRTFVLGEFGRLLPDVATDRLPPAGRDADPQAVYERGVTLVAAAGAIRAGAPPRPSDDLDDPWGHDDTHFKRTADDIEASLALFVELLVPARR